MLSYPAPTPTLPNDGRLVLQIEWRDTARDEHRRGAMQRKLAAILSADVVNYSGMMETDETGTLERLKQNRAVIFDPQVARHGGRVFKLLGDGALAEFPSVIEAVNCAIAIQSATEDAERNSGDERRIRYRIGINVGDIIIEGDDIYGEGVNVAARLQTLAPVGGIALSRLVRDQVKGKAPCDFEDMGHHAVKNIEQPVHVFSVLPARSAHADDRRNEGQRAHTVCVLPFANMSGDPEQEYFSDGISEDIITDLSKVSTLGVVARNTSFQFKGKNVDAGQVARQLRASHVLEGSVRKAAGRVRVTAQLIDGRTGNHVWAERYDRDLTDIFALQDEISAAVVSALKLKLLPEERKAIEQRGTNSAEAYNLYLMARKFFLNGNHGNPRRSDAIIRLTRRAVEIDPNYARAWALMSQTQNSIEVHLSREGDHGRGAAERALALDSELAEAHAALSRVYVSEFRLEDAGREIEMALRLDPESFEVMHGAARYCYAARRFQDAITYFERIALLLPNDAHALGQAMSCYQGIGDVDGARHAAKRFLERAEPQLSAEPDNGFVMSYQVVALSMLGERDRAREVVERASILDPDNWVMRYNFACAFIAELKDVDAGLDILEPILRVANLPNLNWTKSDADLDAVRDHPRFKAMMAEAEARLAEEAKSAGSSP